MAKCAICGGTAGRVIPAEGHHLCQARRRRNLPTPSLGIRCEACGGSGHLKRELPAGILLPVNPSAEEIRRWFPECEACQGRGYTGGDR
jgi:hypothetical protein